MLEVKRLFIRVFIDFENWVIQIVLLEVVTPRRRSSSAEEPIFPRWDEVCLLGPLSTRFPSLLIFSILLLLVLELSKHVDRLGKRGQILVVSIVDDVTTVSLRVGDHDALLETVKDDLELLIFF